MLGLKNVPRSELLCNEKFDGVRGRALGGSVSNCPREEGDVGSAFPSREVRGIFKDPLLLTLCLLVWGSTFDPQSSKLWLILRPIETGGGGAPRPRPPLGAGAPPSLSKRAILSLRRPACGLFGSVDNFGDVGEGSEGGFKRVVGCCIPLLACKAAMRSLRVDLSGSYARGTSGSDMT
jgi:hypothetical protein